MVYVSLWTSPSSSVSGIGFQNVTLTSDRLEPPTLRFKVSSLTLWATCSRLCFSLLVFLSFKYVCHMTSAGELTAEFGSHVANGVLLSCICRHVSLQTTAHPVAAGTHRQRQVSRRWVDKPGADRVHHPLETRSEAGLLWCWRPHL